MLNMLKQWFDPPLFEGDGEKTRQAALLTAILTAVWFYNIALILIELIGGNFPLNLILLNVFGSLFLLLLRQWLQRGNVLLVGGILESTAFVWVTLAAVNLGTIRTPTTASYIVVVIVAGALFGWRGFLFSTLASSMAVLGLIAAENVGLLPAPDYTVNLTQWFTYTGLFAVTGGLAFYTMRITQLALTRAEKEIAERERAEIERTQAEEALKDANQQLRIHLTEIEQLQAELREQALRDPLTGLYNRRYMDEVIAREIARSERENRQLSIIIADIDHFKKVNDLYGHRVGDIFLVEIASLLKAHVRDYDAVCRYGGEEFLMILPGASVDSACKRAEVIRKKCAELVIQHDDQDLRVSMSFGVATYPVHGCVAEELLAKADQALYRSKDTGRNRVTIWEEVMNKRLV
jgi:diguanylate cyclase